MFARQFNDPFFHKTKLVNWRSLIYYFLVLAVFLLLYGEQDSCYCRGTSQKVIEALSYVPVCASCELNFQVLREVGLHEFFKDHISVILLSEPLFEKVDNLKLILFGQFQFFHIGIVYNQIDSKIVSSLIGPNDRFDHVIYHIRIDDKPKAHSSKSPGSFIRVIGSNITVTNLAHRVDSPVE